jgi:hypothetical protein
MVSLKLARADMSHGVEKALLIRMPSFNVTKQGKR